jgi:hypothetical protein
MIEAIERMGFSAWAQAEEDPVVCMTGVMAESARVATDDPDQGLFGTVAEPF